MADIIHSISFDPQSVETAEIKNSEAVLLQPFLNGTSVTPIDHTSELKALEDDLTGKYGATIANWAFPDLMKEEALKIADQESFESFKKMVQCNADNAHNKKFISLLSEKSDLTGSPLSPNASNPSTTRITLGGLSNSGVDCFINAPLQLLKAFGLKIVSFARLRIPLLTSFFNNELTTHAQCCQLRAEINDAILTGHKEFSEADSKDTVVGGKARSQKDAAAFLELLLSDLEVPKIHFKETLRNKNTGEIKQSTGISQAASAILPLTLPPASSSDHYTMQALVDATFAPEEVEGYNWVEKDPSTQTTISKQKIPTDPMPESLVLSVGRFENLVFYELAQIADIEPPSISLKKQNPIHGIFDSITLPSTHEEKVRYTPTAIICHSGDSVNSGHYVCYRKEHGQWLLYNDDYQVGQPATEEDYAFIKKNCYIISYQKTEDPDFNSESIWNDVASDDGYTHGADI